MTITLTGRRLTLALLGCLCLLASSAVPKQEAPPDPTVTEASLLAERVVDERASRARRTPINTNAPQRTPRASAPVVAPPKPTPTAPRRAAPAPSSSRVERVVQYALSQVGDPYRWGADGPDAYDCSGLIVASYRRIGITLPHYTGALLREGWRVSRSAMRRGDLVFTSSSHVGIYLGRNRMVVAPHPGEYVRIQDVYSFYSARRIVS